MTRTNLGCTLVLALSSSSCHLPTAADLNICKHATLSSHLAGPAVLTHSADLKQFTLDFGVISGAQEKATWTLVNPGPLEVSVLKVVDDVDPAWNVGVQQGQTIPAHGQLDLSVTFIPPTNGTFTHSLSIVTDACVLSSVGLTLKGAQVTPPALILSDNLVDFGEVAGREVKSMTVTLSNVSDVDLTVQSGTLGGPQAQAFSAFNPTPGQSGLIIPAHGSGGLVIRFTPPTSPTFSNEHFEAFLTISYCLDGCTTVINLRGDSYECLVLQPSSAIVFDGGGGQQWVQVSLNSNGKCNDRVAVGFEPQFLNQLPDGGAADGGPFSVDLNLVDGGLIVYNYSGFSVNFTPTDNLSYSGTLSLTFSDPIPYALTIPLMGYASCVLPTQGTGFSAYAGGVASAVTQPVPVANTCPKTDVRLSAAPVVWNILSDGGKATEGPFQLGTGAPAAGALLAPGKTLNVPVVYAPTQLTSNYDVAEVDLTTDEPIGGLNSIVVYGQSYGPSLYFQQDLNFTGAYGQTQTQSTYVINYSGDYSPHVPTILGLGTDCQGMDASLQIGVPAPVPNGTWLELDATWTVPSCDGGECGCDGGYCYCLINLITSDLPLPHRPLFVYY